MKHLLFFALLFFTAAPALSQPKPGFRPTDLIRVFPVIRNKNFGVESDMTPLSKPLIGDLMIYYALDQGSTIKFLTLNDISEANLTLVDIETAALANTIQLTSDLSVEGQEVYFLKLDGFYETAFLTMPDFWSDIARQFGPLAMVVPNRDLVVFAPADDAQLVQFLKNTAKTYSKEQPWPVSDQIYFWSEEGPWKLAP
jgi:uncharacterized protein YtpQ (UPF0354 family)